VNRGVHLIVVGRPKGRRSATARMYSVSKFDLRVIRAASLVILSSATTATMADAYIENGATVTVPTDQASPWNTAGILGVGRNSTSGTLIINNGGSVTSTSGNVGYTGQGTATVTGSGSIWANTSNFYVGNGANGTLNIEDGGQVTTLTSYIALGMSTTATISVTGAGSSWTTAGTLYMAASGNGTLNIENGGLVSNTNGIIANNATGVGIVNVRGTGSTWTNTGSLHAGMAGNGTVNVESGGSVTSTQGFIGNDAHSIGKVTVTGAGSQWTNLVELSVGLAGNGTLKIDNGGLVTNTEGSIGRAATGTGQVTVTGAGSRWTNSLALYVGNAGSGTLDIQNGGVVSNIFGVISYSSGSTGAVTVTGAGSRWANAGELYVGYQGNGTLTIEDGGEVTDATAYIGTISGSTSTAAVTGAGSRWSNAGALIVGNSGDGTLTIAGGGTVTSSSTTLAAHVSGRGVLNLNGASGSRGALVTGTLQAGAGTATFNWDGGTLRATGAEANFLRGFSAGAINLENDGGFFDTQGFNVGIATAGILSGTGSFTKLGSGTLSVAGANTYGGNTTISEGTLAFDTYNQGAGQTLTIGARGTGDFGKLNVTGTATFAAGTNVQFDVASASTLAIGNILNNVVTAGTLDASSLTTKDNSALFNFAATVAGNAIDFEIVKNSDVGIQNALRAQGYTQALDAGRVLDTQLGNGAGGDMGNVITALGQLPTESDVASAVLQTLPVHSGLQLADVALAPFQNLVGNQNSTSRSLPAGNALPDHQVWAKTFGTGAWQNDQGGTAGFNGASWGVAFGADQNLSADTRLGLAYGYARTGMDGHAGLSGTAQRVDLDTHVVSAYGSHEISDQLQLLYQADLSAHNNQTVRKLQFGGLDRSARANYLTFASHIGTALAYTLPLSDKTTLTTALRADYTWMNASHYQETGADALNLAVGSQRSDALKIGADAHLLYRLTDDSQVEVNVGVGYKAIHDSRDIVAAYDGAPGDAFTMGAGKPSPWSLKAGLAYSQTTDSGLTLSMQYQAQGRPEFLNHTASVKASQAF
jgi:autotransporter family porin